MSEQRRTTPEQRYLEKKLAEAAVLETQLADRELELCTLRASLASFEARYQGIVSEKYAILDELRARIAELIVQKKPDDEPAKTQAAEQRARAEKSARTARKFMPRPADTKSDAPPPPAPAPFNPAEALKRLYRDIAKAMHPDLADSDRERAHRHVFMSRANEAYEAGSERLLLEVLQEWEMSPASVKGDGAGADLVRTIRKIDWCELRLGKIELELTELRGGALFGLKNMTDEAEKFERDLLEETTQRLDEQIAQATAQLISLGGSTAAPISQE